MHEKKTPMSLVDLGFVKDMADKMADGLNRTGREADDWKKINWNREIERQYHSALLRHLYYADYAGEDAAGHFASAACNAMILHYHAKKEAK
jgi:hypothetical protein